VGRSARPASHSGWNETLLAEEPSGLYAESLTGASKKKVRPRASQMLTFLKPDLTGALIAFLVSVAHNLHGTESFIASRAAL
jgi:hypothetical protein